MVRKTGCHGCRPGPRLPVLRCVALSTALRCPPHSACGSPVHLPASTRPPHPPQIGRDYASGRMLTGEIKAELIAVLTGATTAGFRCVCAPGRLVPALSLVRMLWLLCMLAPAWRCRPCPASLPSCQLAAPLVGFVASEMVERHKRARELVSDDVVDAFMTVRPMTDLYG